MNVLSNLARWVGELSPSCKEAARLQSLALDRPLRPVEIMGLRFHLLFCKWCRAYGKQIRFLRSTARERVPENEPLSSPPALSPDARERIKRSLRSGNQ
ncbi:MAG: zf-HC2 domain-containing protein [Limisphaerales bacterium]